MRFVAGWVLAVALGLATGCASPDRGAPARIGKLNRTYAQLHDRFEKVTAQDPLLATAFADPGQLIVAIRSGLIEELAGNVASVYLDRVAVDLGHVTAHKHGVVERNTLLGKVTLGKWDVRVELGSMAGHLRAGQPRVSLRAPDLIDIDLPVDIEESTGDATLHFEWNSGGIANLVCNDFRSTLTIKGRVLPQRHTLKGALQLRNTGLGLTQTPRFPDRRIQLSLDLTRESWAAVEGVLRSENTFGRCGMFLKPTEALAFLRTLAATGIWVRLPDSIFRTVHLPARLQESVTVNGRSVDLGLAATSLRIETATLWSSVSVQVRASPTPRP